MEAPRDGDGAATKFRVLRLRIGFRLLIGLVALRGNVNDQGIQKGASSAMLGFLYSYFVDQPGPKSALQIPKHCLTFAPLLNDRLNARMDFKEPAIYSEGILQTNAYRVGAN